MAAKIRVSTKWKSCHHRHHRRLAIVHKKKKTNYLFLNFNRLVPLEPVNNNKL